MESNGDLNKISDAMGDMHKVRSFFNNIEVPFSDFGDITIDTHAIAAGWMKPLGSKDDLTYQGLGLQKLNAPNPLEPQFRHYQGKSIIQGHSQFQVVSETPIESREGIFFLQ